DAHWYIDAAHFRDRQRHADLLDVVRRLVRSRLLGLAESGHDRIHHPSALEHYLMTYRKPELPPSWLMVESLTIGQLAGLY
ncbi:Abi family protein, partial [Micrococcus sp. SIMBA_144]